MSIDEPLFEPIPNLIQFTDYEPLQIKTKMFKLRNKDKVARRVRIIQPESRLFQVLPYDSEEDPNNSSRGTKIFSSGSKVAPGLEVTFLIKFSPEAKVDYYYELEITTEREKFVVPIVAIGKRAMIDFPDSINFGSECNVKYKTEKPVIIRNLGDKTTKWELELPKGFQADKSEGVLEYGHSEQIILSFYPTEKTVYIDDAILRYDGLEAYIPITGNAKNGNVSLSATMVNMDPAYIGLETQKTIEIRNESNVKIDFQWRSFPNEKDEKIKKKYLMDQLDAEEKEKRMMLKKAATLENNQDMLEIQDDDDSDYEEVDEKTLMLKKQRKAELLLQRKYKNIKKAIDEDLLLFQDDIFHISPRVGSIWPKSHMTITISFRPDAALKYDAEAHCNISCSDTRLKLTLNGEGLGPTAVLSTNNISIGDIYVNEKKEVPLSIENKGEIPAKFTLLKNNTPFSNMIQFDVEEAELKVTERKNFTMTFKSSKVGEFQETFRWKLEGSEERLELIVRGHVRAPTFEFSHSKIDFGTVSYQFDKEEYITLENTSNVPFKFHLRIPADAKSNEKEFEIKPEADVIEAGKSKEIRVKFTPRNKKHYYMVMVLDIDGVGKDMKSIPLEAKSDVPIVRLSTKELNFGQVFLRESKRMTLMLINESNLDARFQVIPQIPDSTSVAEISTDRVEGIIEKLKNIPLEVSLIPQKIVPINLDLFIKILDNTNNMHTVKILATTTGPEIKLLTTELNFGDVPVLKDMCKEIKVVNPSTIKADFVVFTKNENSVFKPIQRNYTLKEGKEMTIKVVCNPDDTIMFKDTLFFVITEGKDQEVRLRAKGVGETLFSKESLDCINFATKYTYREHTKEIFIENKGRRTQKVRWERKKEEKVVEEGNAQNRKPQNIVAIPEEDQYTFNIFPQERELPPKTGIMFQFRAVSSKVGVIKEEFILTSTKDGDRKNVPVKTTEVTGKFIDPSLKFDKDKIEFKYKWEKGVEMKKLYETINITCNSVLPTNIKLEIEKPFDIKPDSFALLPNKTVTARIEFDPALNHSLRSGIEKRELCLRHYKHPHKDKLMVTGIFAFPNLKLETHDINFGSVLNDTSKKIYMNMTNVSEMNVEYEWSFLEDENSGDIPTNEIFDILPLNGVLEPGMTEQVEFVYYGMPDQKFTAKAVCQVVGGPDEKVNLVGESSRIKYKLSTTTASNTIDFGEAVFSCWSSKDFTLENLGKVPFDFKIKMDAIVRKGLIKISPSQGKIAGMNKTKITINFCPALPGDYLESFKIQVAHFEAETITLRGFGLYPALKFELPRLETEEMIKRIEEDGISFHNASIDSTSSRKSIRYPSNESVAELDKKLLYNAIMKNIERREATTNNNSLDSSVADIQNTRDNVSATQQTMRSTANFRRTVAKFEKKLIDKIIVAVYTLDLGNVIAGKDAKGNVRIYNVGKMKVNLNFDQNNIRNKGLRLNQTKVNNLNNKEQNWVDLRIDYHTTEKTEPSQYTFQIPVEISNGPKYLLVIKANVTVPEIISSLSEIDFAQVIVGQRKTITIRFSNNKEVDCKWSVASKDEMIVARKKTEKNSEGRFSMSPKEGLLATCTQGHVQVTFVPNNAKNYTYTFYIVMKENQEQIEIVCKGAGVIPNLEFIPKNELIFKPSLPYNDNVYRTLQVRNNSNFNVELFSLDFDQQYKLEDKMLEAYNPHGSPEVLYLDVKKAGSPFWQKIEAYYSVYKHNEEISSKIKSINEDPEMPPEVKENRKKELVASRKDYPEEVQYPKRIDDHLKRYIVVWGPQGCGKTKLAKRLAKEHLRGVVNLNELLDWNKANKTAAATKAEDLIFSRIEDKELYIAEKEKERKKKKIKDGEPIDASHFSWLPNDLLLELLQERMKDIDCNTGAIFDNLYSENFENELVILQVIFEACKKSEIQIINLHIPTDSHGLLVCEPIDPHYIKACREGASGDQLGSSTARVRAEPAQPRESASPTNQEAAVRRVASGGRRQIRRGGNSTHNSSGATRSRRNNIANNSQDDMPTEALEEPDKFEPFNVDAIREYEQEEIDQFKIRSEEFYQLFLNKLPEEKIHKFAAKLAEEEEAKIVKKPPPTKKPVKGDGKNIAEEEPPAQEVQEPEDEILEFPTNRFYNDLTIVMNHEQMFYNALEVVPEVNFPDPMTLPDPDPVTQQIVKRIFKRRDVNPLTNVEIFTPQIYLKDEYIEKKINEEFDGPREETSIKIAELEQRKKAEIQRLIEEEKERIRIAKDNRKKEFNDKFEDYKGRLDAGEMTPDEFEAYKQQLEREFHDVLVETPHNSVNDLERKVSNPNSIQNPSKVVSGNEEEDSPADLIDHPKSEPELKLTSNELQSIYAEIDKLKQELEASEKQRREQLELAEEIDIDKNTLNGSLTRWIIPAERTIYLIVKFFSKEVMKSFENTLDFENTFIFNRPTTYKISAICDFPSILTNPVNVFPFRKRKRGAKYPENLISKHYITNEDTFYFGPLLIGKNPDERRNEDMMKMNSTIFRISNDGKYKAEVSFDLASSVIDKKGYKKGIYFFEPENMDLEVGETKEVRVWSVPDEPKEFIDELICMTRGNPKPFIIKMKSLGSKPEVRLNTNILQFERILLDKEITKTVKVVNEGTIPAKWSLKDIEELPGVFKISMTEGVLKPSKEATIEITFASSSQMKYDQTINLAVQDIEEVGIKMEVQPLQLLAEAFNISVDFEGFEKEEQMIEFGDVEVGRRVDRSFEIMNKGLYEIKYSFKTMKKIFRENFVIEPKEGVIKAGERQKITVIFKCDSELRLRGSASKPDIILEILEGQSKEVFNEVFINVNVNAVYSIYSITPGRSINFGPLQFNENSTRMFEIRNDGLFEFRYTIFDYADEEKRLELAEAQKEAVEDMQKVMLEEKGKKAVKKEEKKKTAKKGADPLALNIGQFIVTPAYGDIPPQSSVQVQVTFNAVKSQLYEQRIAIDILNRDPEDQPKGIPYDLLGESCIPLINNINFEAIFEEQIVVQSLTATGKSIQDVVNSNIFCIEERAFYFGNLIPSKYPDGVREKFKIINTGKIHAQVKFEVTKSSTSANDLFAFEVFPSTAKIPPHESVYVKVTFKPTIMAQYSGQFSATVTNTDPTVRNNGLQFALKGQGVLPTLKLEQPRIWENDSNPVLTFPRVRKGKRLVETVVIKNDGIIPATVKFDVTGDPNFNFLTQTSYTLSPKAFYQFQIEFRPSDIGKFEWPVTFSTILNPYEQTKILVRGECYFEGIAFEGLPMDKDDEIIFGDNVAGVPKRVTFFMKNFTDKQKKFNWELQALEGLTIKPQKGHINARGTKAIHITLLNPDKVQHNKAKILCVTSSIFQTGDKFIEWDDSRRRRKFVTPTEQIWIKSCEEAERVLLEQEAEFIKKGKKAPKRKDDYLPPKPEIPEGEKKNVEIQEPVPEPEHDMSAEKEEIFPLLVSANVDAAKYQCSTSQIEFRPTMMYTSRIHSFSVKNTSLIAMPYKWVFVDAEDDEDPGYYSIVPEKGRIAPNYEESFEIKFSPLEVESSNYRVLRCLMPNLSEDAPLLEIKINADAERPVCHFELPLSSYLDTKGGDIPNIDNSKVKVIEFDSLGIKVRNKKRFYVVNPTATGYEFTWKRLDMDQNQQQDLSSFFRCGVEKGVVLSGKKFEMMFEYKPEVPGTHEGLWLFEIPKYKLKQYFLTVGRVLEPKVFFEVGKVDFGPLLLSGKNKETIKLKNLDHLPYHFNFSKVSIRGENEYGDSLNIAPISGVVNGDSEIPIVVSFKPKIEGEYNYNLICNVAQKPTPLNLNVKGIGYVLHHSVHIGDQHSPVLVSNDIHNLDFGENFVNETRTKSIVIRNNGDFNFDFVVKKTNFSYVNIIPETATVKTGSSVELQLVFQPLKEYRLKATLHQVTLAIVSGPSYYFRLSGSGRRPGVDLSFTTFDFGPSFVTKNPIPRSIVLRMYNRDNAAMTIEPLFEKKDYLDVQLASGQVLLPKEDKGEISGTLDIPIVFTPREIKKYEEIVSFDINQLHKVDVKITGEGIPLKLDLSSAEDSFIDYGICRIGADITRIASLANYSKRPVSISFNVEDQLQAFNKLGIAIFPESDITVKAKDRYDIELRFNPKQRINQFKKELRYKLIENEEEHKLLTIQGCCHGMELKLLEDSLNFSGVVIGSRLTKQLQLNNMGDIGARFQWETTFCSRYFTITPDKGFVPANDSIKFEVSFHPDIADDIQFNIKCLIENSNPLNLSLSGKGISQKTEDAQDVQFETIVRTSTSKKVQVKNPTSSKWRIKASITTIYDRFGGYFSGPEYLEVGANSTAEYPISYQPLSMTAVPEVPEIKDTLHEAKLFFPLPDGTALMYDLKGKSLPPQALGNVVIDVKAKKETIHTIAIENWLNSLQRFDVTWDVPNENKSIIVRGANTIDLPGHGKRSFKLSVYGIKQGNVQFKLTMKNKKTGEYIFFNVQVVVGPAESLKEITLTSVVRETASTVISVYNPLETAVEFKKEQIVMDSDTLVAVPASFVILPKTVTKIILKNRNLDLRSCTDH